MAVSDLKGKEAAFLHSLSLSEKAHYHSLWPRRRALEWLAGRIAAKLLIQSKTGASLGSIEIQTVAEGSCKGRPFYGRWFLSISHSNGLAGAAISLKPVGLDIELVRSRPHMESVAFSEEERRSWDGLSSEARAHRSTQRWTEIEAIAKFRGRGLSDPFSCFVRPPQTVIRQGLLQLNSQALCWTLMHGSSPGE